MKQLSESQTKILNYLRQRSSEGVPPSVREICAATGLKSTSTVHSYLKVLEEEGYISRQAGLNRNIKVNDDFGVSAPVQVPIIGTVTAGLPILAVEDIEGYIPMPSEQVRGKELFALRVQGDSMINAAILDGDIVVVERSLVARNGDIVVALLDDEATVKRFYKENEHFRLQAENPDYDPIVAKEITILGKVITCIRWY